MLLSGQWNYFHTALSNPILFHPISMTAIKFSCLQIDIPHGHRHKNLQQNISKPGYSLAVQRLGLHTSTAGGLGLIPSRETDLTSHAAWPKINN